MPVGADMAFGRQPKSLGSCSSCKQATSGGRWAWSPGCPRTTQAPLGVSGGVLLKGQVPPGTCPELAHCACRQGTGRSPHFAGLFGAVGPRLQDWVETLRAMAGGSLPAPTADEDELPRETWLFLQVFGDGWAGGGPTPLVTVPPGTKTP